MIALLRIGLLIIVACSASFSQDTFVNPLQLEQLYDMLIHEIETIDAEAIETRNKSKKTKWKEWVVLQKSNFTNAKSYSELNDAFVTFNRGFVNAHARPKFMYPIQEKYKPSLNVSIKMGYTFPEINFFDQESKQKIVKLNDTNIEDVFAHHTDFLCKGNTSINCARAFKIEFESGTLKVANKDIKSVTLENGDKLNLTFEEVEAEDRYAFVTSAIDFQNMNPSWKLIASGYKVAIWKKNDVVLIKTKNFVYPLGSDGGLRCPDSAADSTQCGDIQIIRTALSKINNEVSHLILDVQDNPGGNENSRFIAELCPMPFKDLAVQYRKSSFLEDPELRNHLFYYSDRTENWYQKIKVNGIYKATPDLQFFPPIADFCQGAEDCALDFIEPNPSTKKDWENIIVLINEGTASSGDDFAYRMKFYADAKIVGQTQSADLSYSLLTVFFYLDQEGNVRKKYYGNNSKDLEVQGTPLFTFDIPFSRSIDNKGNLLQGNPLKLDLEVTLTKDNFAFREKFTLESAIKEFVK